MHKDGTEEFQGAGFLLNDTEVNPLWSYEATVHNPVIAGIVFGYADSGDYMMLGIDHEKLLIRRRYNGVNQTMKLDVTVPKKDKHRLSVTALSYGLYYCYVDDKLVKSLFGYLTLGGRIGVFDGAPDLATKQTFTDIKVEGKDENFSEERLIPVVDLDIKQKPG